MKSRTEAHFVPFEAQIPPGWRLLLRPLWLLATAIALGLTLGGLPARYGELQQLCDGPVCASLMLTPGEAGLLGELGVSLPFYATYLTLVDLFLVLLFGGVALLIYWRKSADWSGYLVSLSLIFLGTLFYGEGARALERAYPALSPFIGGLTDLSIVLAILIFYIFPNGHFAPRWFGAVLAFLGLAIVLEPAIFPAGPQAASASLGQVVTFVAGALLGLISQVYRYRRVSTHLQRQQTKWVLIGFVVLLLPTFLWAFLVEIFPLPPGPARLIFVAAILPQYLLISCFPLSFLVAFQRHRLWDIDILIRRTLVYTLLTGLLALVYFGSVVLLQTIFGLISGEQSPAVIVLSTLLIAALFNPLRRRVQNVIDRRFFRQKYDAQKVLAAFAVTARDETDLDKFMAALSQVIDETMQPSRTTIWIGRSQSHQNSDGVQ